MKKPVKYGLGILAVLLVLFFSFDIKKLDEIETSGADKFDATEYAADFFTKKLPLVIDQAPDIGTLTKLLQNDPANAFEQFGHKLGISKTWYFMVRGEGTIDSVEEENLVVTTNSGFRTRVATSFIFGNAVRDGSGAVDIDEFLNMTDFNNVSIAINDIVKNEVVPPLREKAKPGMKITFAGAFEIKEDDIDIQSTRIIPVAAEIFNV